MASYVLLGNLSAEWATKQKQRTAAARAKAKELGISILSVNYTQGPYDFVDIVEAPSGEAAMAFSIWYAAKGYGRVITMPSFDEARFNAALAKV